MGKIFNIAGPCNPGKHYMLPAMARLPEVMRLIEDEAYFVVHAQRQCGKTTALRALAKEINAKGERVAMYCSVEIIREMALGKGALDLGVLFRGGKYAVEVKLKYNYEKNREKAYDQVCRYMDHLGESEGWLVVFDPDLGGDWDAKLSHEDIDRNGKVMHLFRC